MGANDLGYMGPAGAVPELQALEMALVTPSHRYVTRNGRAANWVKAPGRLIDTAHCTSRICRSRKRKRNPRQSRSTS